MGQMRRMMARISSFALSNDPFPSKANNSEFQVQLNKPDSQSCAVAKRENFWQATGQSWHTNGWPQQKLPKFGFRTHTTTFWPMEQSFILSAKFHCPVARQSFSLLATAHDRETGNLWKKGRSITRRRTSAALIFSFQCQYFPFGKSLNALRLANQNSEKSITVPELLLVHFGFILRFKSRNKSPQTDAPAHSLFAVPLSHGLRWRTSYLPDALYSAMSARVQIRWR